MPYEYQNTNGDVARCQQKHPRFIFRLDPIEVEQLLSIESARPCRSFREQLNQTHIPLVVKRR